MGLKFRRVIAASALACLCTVIAAAPANAATAPGTGSAGGNVTLVSVDYGDIIKASILGEANSASIDLTQGTPRATETLSPLDVTSVAIPLLDAASITPTKTDSTGALDQKSLTPPLDLSTLGVPGLTGVLDPASLSSIVDTAGARSLLNAKLADLSTLGVLDIDSSTLNIGTGAAPAASSAGRSVTANAVSVLNLQALLNLFGVDLSAFDLESITTFLGALGEIDTVNTILGTTNFESPADITAQVSTLTSAIGSAATTQILDQLALIAAQAVVSACSGNQSCIDAAQPAVDTAQGLLDAATAALTTLQTDLTNLLNAVVDVAANTPLLALDGVTAGATATAADTLANSAATTTGTISDVRVGGLDLGAVNANTTADQLTALTTHIISTVNDALTALDPAFGDLLSLKLLERKTQLFEQNGYTNAVAGITAFALTINPADICDVLNGLPEGNLFTGLPGSVDLTTPDSPVRDALGNLESTVDVISLCDEQLKARSLTAQGVHSAAAGDDDGGEGGIIIDLSAVPALTGPVTFKAASVNSVANFKVSPSAPTTTVTPASPALPRTGMNETLLLVVGGLMAAFALGVRRVSRRAATVPVTTRHD